MIQDLHSHTYYSFCGKDSPETIVEAAINGGIELFGICDHNSGINFGNYLAFAAPSNIVPNEYNELAFRKYFEHMSLIKEKYSPKIKVLVGVEVTAHLNIPKIAIQDGADLSYFDYCLIENPDMENSIIKKDLFSFAEKLKCKNSGVAHTDMFKFIKSLGEDPYKYFKKMAKENIFWEMNLSYDSIHNYREHEYVKEFFDSKEQQQIIRESGVKLSVGFDGHRVEDYLPDRVADFCSRITDMGIKLAFEK